MPAPLPTPARGIAVWDLRGAAAALRVEHAGSAPLVEAPAAAAAWADLRAANPRLHDGRVVLVHDAEPPTGRLRAAPGDFRTLAVQHHPAVGDCGVRALGVKGVLIGEDARGEPRVLLARRGSQTRVYGGQWEIGPAGMVDGPAIDRLQRHGLELPDLAGIVLEEGHEELGADLAAACDPPVSAFLLRDDIAFSFDVIFALRWRAQVAPKAGLCAAAGCAWEYVGAAWLSRADLGRFRQTCPGALTPPSEAVLHALGWL